MAPKPIMIADSDSFDARTTDDAILISKSFLQKNPTVTEVNNLLKRELLKNVRKIKDELAAQAFVQNQATSRAP